MPRVRLWTAQNLPIAQLFERKLRDAGFPVTSQLEEMGAYGGVTQMASIWLEDDALLEDPATRTQIESILLRDDVGAIDEDELARQALESAPLEEL
jgi:hypothetical protein